MNETVQKKTAYRGKTFYIMLAAMIAMLLLGILCALYISLTSYQSAREQSTQALDIAMRAYDLYLQEIKTSPTNERMEEVLNADGAVDALRQAGAVDEELTGLLRERLDVLREITDDSDRHYYLYFEESGLWVFDSTTTEEQRTFTCQAFDEVKKDYTYAPDDLNFTVSRILPCPSGEKLSVGCHRIRPGVLMLQIGTQPVLPSPLELSDLFETAEMYFIDKHDGIYPFLPNTSLMGKFTYEDVAPDGDNHIIHLTIDGVPYRCYTHATNPGSLVFVFLSPDVAAMHQADLTGMTLMIAAVLVLLGAAVSYVVINHLYRPIRSIIEQMNDRQLDSNEFRLISSAMSDMESRIDEQNAVVDRYRLLCALRGQDDEGEWMYRLGFVDAHSYVVAALRVDARGASEPGWKDMADLEALLSEYLKDCGAKTAATVDSGLLFVLFGAASSEELQVAGLLTAFKELAESRENLLISAFVSKAGCACNSPSQAYNQVLELVDYVSMTEEFNVVVEYDKLRGSIGNTESAAALHRDARLGSAIIALNEEKALKLFDDIVKEIMAGESLSYIRLRLAALKSHIMLACSEAETASLERAPDVSIAERFSASDASSTSRMREILAGILAELKNESAHTGSGDSQFEEMLQFVNDHYRDPSFSASTVAKHFGTSQSNVTRIFNRCNNSGFLEYVHQLRISKARELLCSTGYPISEIALMVGYTNALTMTRAFKRYTGTTPGSFRGN